MEWLGEIIARKGCIENHGFAMGIDAHKLLRTWRDLQQGGGGSTATSPKGKLCHHGYILDLPKL